MILYDMHQIYCWKVAYPTSITPVPEQVLCQEQRGISQLPDSRARFWVKDGNFWGIKSTFLATPHNRMPYRKEVVHMFGLPEGRQHRVETAAVADTESAQGKQFPKQELRGYVHKV